MSPFFLIVVLIVAAVAPYVIRDEQRVRKISLALTVLAVAIVWSFNIPALFGNTHVWYGDWFATHQFSALVALLVSVVYLTANVVSLRYVDHERAVGALTAAQARLYFASIHLFSLCMFTTLMANNTMLLWIALEGTTLSTTLLVALYKRDAAVEAAWKYVILCSTGIGLGLIGAFIASYAAINGAGATVAQAFSFSFLLAHASTLDPALMHWAFVFLFIGFGTKVGLVPMHTWLPDAHSQTPSPISGMLSGVLLNVALYAILRYKTIVDGVSGSDAWSNNFFIVFGVMSVALPAFILLAQKNYKRMLAYSSIEHMGLVTFAFGLGPIGTIAGLMHMIGHAIIKSALFFNAGEILLRVKTTKINLVRGLVRVAPITSTLWVVGFLAILGAPPFSLFASEFQLMRVGFGVHPVLTTLVVILLTIVAFGMMRHAVSMIFGDPTIEVSESVGARGHDEHWNVTHTVVTLQLVCVIILGFWFMTDSGYGFIESVAHVVRF